MKTGNDEGIGAQHEILSVTEPANAALFPYGLVYDNAKLVLYYRVARVGNIRGHEWDIGSFEPENSDGYYPIPQTITLDEAINSPKYTVAQQNHTVEGIVPGRDSTGTWYHAFLLASGSGAYTIRFLTRGAAPAFISRTINVGDVRSGGNFTGDLVGLAFDSGAKRLHVINTLTKETIAYDCNVNLTSATPAVVADRSVALHGVPAREDAHFRQAELSDFVYDDTEDRLYITSDFDNNLYIRGLEAPVYNPKFVRSNSVLADRAIFPGKKAHIHFASDADRTAYNEDFAEYRLYGDVKIDDIENIQFLIDIEDFGTTSGLMDFSKERNTLQHTLPPAPHVPWVRHEKADHSVEFTAAEVAAIPIQSKIRFVLPYHTRPQVVGANDQLGPIGPMMVLGGFGATEFQNQVSTYARLCLVINNDHKLLKVLLLQSGIFAAGDHYQPRMREIRVTYK